MWVVGVVVLKPEVEAAENRKGIRAEVYAGIGTEDENLSGRQTVEQLWMALSRSAVPWAWLTISWAIRPWRFSISICAP